MSIPRASSILMELNTSLSGSFGLDLENAVLRKSTM
jgi:hypothetical protein